MTKRKVYDPEVPLFLIATAVAEGVRKRGGKLFRISIVRTHSHVYRIKYKCRVKEAGVSKVEMVTHEPDAKLRGCPADAVPEAVREIPAGSGNGGRDDGRTGT